MLERCTEIPDHCGVAVSAFRHKGGMSFGEDVVLYDGYHSDFDEDLTEDKWSNITRGYIE